MGEVHYMISEAAKRVNMETHVLRHWEEELGLQIGRTEMGHRYYTEEDVQLFRCIKELKEQGMLLKELKDFIPEILKTKEKLKAKKETAKIPTELENAFLTNNQLLTEQVTASVIKEITFLFQANERQEEERFKKLDCLIRQQQHYRKEFSRTTPLRQFRKIFEG